MTLANADQNERALEAVQNMMQRSEFSSAAQRLEGLLAVSSDDEQALYMLAVCQRYQKQFDKASHTLSQLLRLAPEFGRAYQELGHLHRDSDNVQSAISSYEDAVKYNPTLFAAWDALAKLLAKTDRRAEALTAKQQSERLKALPKTLVAAMNFLHEGKLLKAENLCRAFLRQVPHHVEAMRLLAEIGVRLGVLDDADFLLESAIELEPDNIQLRLDYIQVLRKRQKFEAALKEAEALNARAPDNPIFQSHLAIESMQVGDHERALGLFEEILQKLPEDPATLTSRGHALKTIGSQESAISSYRQAIAVRPEQGEAYYALANLKTYKFEDKELAGMEALIKSERLGHQDQTHLQFALAKAYEDRGEFEEAMTYYQSGNALKQRMSRYDAGQMTEELARQKEFFSKDFFAERETWGCLKPDPIFIVGLPRAGSTLLEQILASHSQVDGTLELPNIPSLVQQLRRRRVGELSPGYPDVVDHLSETDCLIFGKEYLATTAVHRQGAPFFTDKMPNNFRHIGLIHMILPNARIIDARRHPLDCCFSGFKQLFAEGQEFTYGLEEVGRYYRDYIDLMAFWDEVLPGKILRVHYEDVVGDLENQVRRLLSFCDLPFEEGCIAFHETERSVRTASSEQVRQPLYQSGMEQWRSFEPWLAPLKEALGTALTEYKV